MKTVKLGDFTEKIGSGKTPLGGSRSYLDRGIPLIRSQNVLMRSFTRNGIVFISDDQHSDMSGSEVRPRDVLLNITGASIGRVCVVPNDVCPANVNQHVCIIRLSADMDSNWLSFYLSSPAFQIFIMESQAGGTRQALNLKQIGDFRIPDIEITEQHRVAARVKAQLAEVETAHQTAEVQVADFQSLETRILDHLFSEVVRCPSKKIGEYAATNSGSTPSRGNKAYWEPAEIPWVKTAEVAFKPITQTEEGISQTALKECSVKLLPVKTVLIAMYGQGKTRGQSAILDVEATTNQACFAILPNDTWLPEFMQLWLTKSYSDLRSMSEDRGGNQSNLNGGLLKALEVPAPSKTEQMKLLEKAYLAMAEVETARKAAEVQLAEIKVLPQKILAAAFETDAEGAS